MLIFLKLKKKLQYSNKQLIYLVYLDIDKAYDSVTRNKI